MQKRSLSFWEIWNVSFGFLGVQFGFALQNANISNVLENLGADLHSLSYFWLAAPIMGIIVQPIVGGASDLTWNKKFGRRGPFILAGAFFAALGMYLMPNSPLFVQLMPAMFFGGLMLALMDGSFNVTMQPFRALVADMLPEHQRNKGYSIQSLLINIGAVIGSALPFILTNGIKLSNVAEKGSVSESVTWAFYIGATILLGSVLWTVFKTKEYPPEVYYQNEGINPEEIKKQRELSATKSIGEKIKDFFGLVVNMPKTMKQLALVQFFSWFALFLMWVYTTPAIGQYIWEIPSYYYGDVNLIPSEISEQTKQQFLRFKGEAGDWVGILFAGYSLFAAIFSIIMISLSNKFGRKPVYSFSLFLGGISYLSFLILNNAELITIDNFLLTLSIPKGALLLILPMIGVGIAWSAILAMPYAILSNALPADKMGIYMGIFNITIAGPQIVAGLFGKQLLSFFNDQPISMIALAGVSMLIASALVFVVQEKKLK